jgi:tetratricopeptide (TPR) repeat protein
MDPTASISEFLAAPGAHVLVLEAPAGLARRALVDEWAAAARAGGASAAWALPCDAERHGLWGGLADWMMDLAPRLERDARDLLVRHDAELVAVAPELLTRIRPRYVTLTDAAENDEGVRNYARDRAHRIPQGVVDLLDSWHERSGGGRWALACDGVDRCGALVERFFRALVRRRGDRLGLVMLAAVDPGRGDAVAEWFAPHARVHRAAADLPAGGEPELAPDEAARQAAEMEAWVMRDTLDIALHLHELIRLWGLAGDRRRHVAWHARALSLYAHRGYYEDAFRHLPPVRDSLDFFDGDTAGVFYTRARIVSNLRITYITNNRPDEALRVVVEEGLGKLTDPVERARAFYIASMLHARHLPVRDQEAAEGYLRAGLAELERAELDAADRHFLTGFLLNGLAYIRFRQGNAEEAAALSHANYERLDENLPPGRHRLHRSVLLYNAGQVYARTGQLQRAVEQYTQAMEMDPSYSEYYNDRGNLYLKMGRLPEAERDYQQAIELSPPYPEVWFNLGQCHARQERTAEAERAFARAVDLDPDRAEAWTNLARARQALGRPDEALAAYDAALAADPASPASAFVLANRAALRLARGRGDEALADLDRAVELAPQHPGLQRNRQLAMRALGREPALA